MNILHTISSLQGSAVIYAAIFLFSFLESIVVIGLFVPGTTTMLFIGYLCSVAKVDFFLAVSALTVGGVTGDVLSFHLGKIGKKATLKIEKDIGEKNILRAESFFKKFGPLSVVAGRFVGPLRPLLPFAAGLLRMPKKLFIPFDVVGNALSAAAYVSIGFFVGHRWSFFVSLVFQYEKFLIVILVIAALLYYLLSKRK